MGNLAVIWAKTDSGRIEIQARALVKERAQRNLLLLIDGNKSQEMLLGNLTGIGLDDFDALRSLGLIAPVGANRPAAANGVTGDTSPGALSGPSARPASAPTSGHVDLDVDIPAAAQTEDTPLDYASFTAALTQIISKELGLRGFMLTLAVEKADTNEALQDVARRALAQVRARKGDAAADAARRLLYGR